MIAILGLIFPIIGQGFSAVAAYFGKKQDVLLEGVKTSLGTDVQLGQSTLDAKVKVEGIKSAQNAWIGAKIIAGSAGELTVFYYGSIVLDSMFHFGWNIAKLPAPWDQYAWIILSSFIVVSPVAPVLSATTAWLGRR